jgi:hypothetical protein
MSKIINNNKFDNKSLGINREINEEIGQLKNNRIHYTSNQIQKNNKSKEKLYQNQRINIKFEERNKYANLYPKKSNTKISYNNRDNHSISKDKSSKKSSSKSKDKVKMIKTHVIKKRNIGQVERVVIDLINEDIDSIKTEQSNIYSIYDSEKHFRNNKEISESIQFRNKDNNGTNSTNSINEKLMAINKIEGRWVNNSISNQEVNLYYIYDEIQRQKKQIYYTINMWKENTEIKKEADFNFISKIKPIDLPEKWNNENKISKGNNLVYIVDIIKNKEKEMNDLIKKNNDLLNEENQIIKSFEKLKNKNNFKYLEERYLKDVLSKASFTENSSSNTNIFYLLNINNALDNSSKLNYKVINPKEKTELEKLVINFYNENKLNSNNEILEINPLLILNEEQMNQLYERLNKIKVRDSASITGTDSKKENHETQYTISKQIAIDYEIIEQTISNISKTEKSSEVRKLYQNFGQCTPITMLYDKFLVFGVSRNIKYSVHSPQSNICFPCPLNKIKTSSSVGFDKEKLSMNKFSLWVEKIDKIDSIISTDKKEKN